MIESVDDSVGRILRKLDALGIAGNTVVIFMSDNGGLWPQATSNAPLRAGKGYPYEGGIREPLIIKWPGITQPGAHLQRAGQQHRFLPDPAGDGAAPRPPAPGGWPEPGAVAASKPARSSARRSIWHYPHYWGGNRVRPFGAVRAGDWKLIEFYEDMRVELYNLKDDLGEARDLAQAEPEKAAQLARAAAPVAPVGGCANADAQSQLQALTRSLEPVSK